MILKVQTKFTILQLTEVQIYMKVEFFNYEIGLKNKKCEQLQSEPKNFFTLEILNMNS